MSHKLEPGFCYRPEQVLLQAGAMLLLDSIEAYGADWVESGVRIRRGDLFADALGVPGWVGIEYMAQTVAAWGGIEQLQAGAEPTIGLLIGARRYDCEVQHFAFESLLRVRATLVLTDEQGLAVFDCAIHEYGPDQAPALARAQLKVYRPPDLHPYLEGTP